MEKEAGHYDATDDVKREKEPLINTVKLQEKSLVMQTVNRNRTVDQIKVNHQYAAKTDNKYRPNYNAVEANSNNQIKWIPSENEMEFHYEHNE